MTALIPWRARWILTMATVAVALVLAGQASAGPVATASGAKKVHITNFTFKPGKLVVMKGTKVSFSNSDGVAHTATARSFNTGTIGSGKSKMVKFSHAGIFSYHCSIHPSMHGKIVVK
jgi:plastocyanin